MLIGISIDDRTSSFTEVSGLFNHRILNSIEERYRNSLGFILVTDENVIFSHLVHPSESTALLSRTYVSNVLSNLFL